MANYYAVKVGKKVGLFENWDECNESINGFKGAKFKKFSNLDDANHYLEFDEEETQVLESELIKLNDINDNEIIVYTDGSYTPKYDYVSYGCVCLSKNIPEYRISGVTTDKYNSNQVFGEIKGVLEAIDYSIYKGFKKAYILHDYEGLGKWISGEWKLKQQISMDYFDEIKARKESIEIEFVKVAAHTGNKYNEIVDKLAKNELKSLEPSKEDDYGFRSFRYSDEHLESSLNKLKLLIENFNYTKEIKSNHSIYTCVVGKEKLTFQKYHFESGNCLTIPRKQNEKIFQLLLSFLNDKDTIDTILLNLNCNNNTNIDKDIIRKKLYEIAPALENVKINIDIYRLLVQGVYNLFLNIDYIEDSSYITAPVLRAIEGQLKFVFKNDLNIVVDKFNFFDFDGNQYTLQNAHALKIDSSKVSYINKCYNYYNAIRHKIFHFGDLDISDTKLMNNKESKEVIMDSIKLIEEYYK